MIEERGVPGGDYGNGVVDGIEFAQRDMAESLRAQWRDGFAAGRVDGYKAGHHDGWEARKQEEAQEVQRA